jgi:hypothetical protein
MTADQLISKLANDGHTLRAENGQLIIEPRIPPSMREMVRAQKQQILEALARYPTATAPARDFAKEPPRRDELARERRRWPQPDTGPMTTWARRFPR